MKVLLIDPKENSISNEPPLGLAYIAAYISDECEVKILDRSAMLCSMSYLVDEIIKYKPEIIGITVYTITYIDVKLLIQEIRKRVSVEITIVLGGPHITICTNQVCNELKDKNLLLVSGEGELVWKDIIKHHGSELLYSVKGVAYYDGKEVIINEPQELIDDINILPMPARHLLDMEHYYKKTGYSHIISSRGCPYSCTFCSSATLWRNTFRCLSVEKIIEEIKFLLNNYDVKKIAFYDDVFTMNKERLYTLCKKIKEENLQFKWWCNGRINTVDRDMLLAMKEAGCHQIFYGIESGNQRTLDLIKKRTTVEDIRRVVKITKECGIVVSCSFIIGLPYETYDDVLNTINFIAELEPDVIDFNFYKPYPSTELTENMHVYGMRVCENAWEILHNKQAIMGAPVVDSDYLSLEEQYKLYVIAAEPLGLLKQHSKIVL